VTTPTLDPHLEEILRDIESDPRARMFQTSPRQLFLGLRGSIPRISPRQAGLTSAERELLEVHRGELAWLLCTAAKTALVNKEDPRTPVSRWTTPDQRFELPSLERWRELAEQHRFTPPRELAEHPAQRLLGSLLRPGEGPRSSAHEMALASTRLVPRDATRVVLAYSLMEGGKDGSSLGILLNVLHSRCSPLTRSIALVNLSAIRMRQGQELVALEALRTADDLETGRVTPVLNELCLYLRIGDADGVISSALRLEALVDADHPAVTEFVQARQRKTVHPEAEPTRESLLLIPSIRNRLPKVARRITDVYSP